MCAPACVRERASESVRDCINERGCMRVFVRYRACVIVPARTCVRERA